MNKTNTHSGLLIPQKVKTEHNEKTKGLFLYETKKSDNLNVMCRSKKASPLRGMRPSRHRSSGVETCTCTVTCRGLTAGAYARSYRIKIYTIIVSWSDEKRGCHVFAATSRYRARWSSRRKKRETETEMQKHDNALTRFCCHVALLRALIFSKTKKWETETV